MLIKKLTNETDKRNFISNYSRQLRRQEDAINSLSPDELISAIESYKKYGRESSSAQKAFTEKFKNNLKKSIESSLLDRNPQMSIQKIQELSTNRANEITSKLAALHDPDQVVGGFFSEIKHMGRRDVNGAIGGSWSGGRVNQLLNAARKQKANGDTKMNVSLTAE